MVRKVFLTMIPFLLLLSGCTSKEEARTIAVERFDACQAAMIQALRPYLYVLRNDTNEQDNYEDSDYYVRYYSVPLDENTEMAIMLESYLGNLNTEKVSVTLSHTYQENNTVLPKKYLPVFSSVIQATGNTQVTETLCKDFMEDPSVGEATHTKENYDERSYVSDDGHTFLYYYDDGEYTWNLTYEGELEVSKF